MTKFLQTPLQAIDSKLNSVTMYALLLKVLPLLALIAIIFGFTGILDYSGWSLTLSLLLITATSILSNLALEKFFHAQTNKESSTITGFILFFILAPLETGNLLNSALILMSAAVLANASKYLFAIHKKHIFNPAAFATFTLGVLGNGAAIWWVGAKVLAPFTLILGLLVVRKIRRGAMFAAFLAAALTAIGIMGTKNGLPLGETLLQSFAYWPLFFFGTIMLTEPLTSPTTTQNRVIFGALVGALFGSQFHIGPIFASPEFALLVGNVFAYLVSSKQKLMLTLKETREVANGIYEFSFQPDQKLIFRAGQFLEWTLPHTKSDDRGNRRYFTVASSPTETDIKLGIRINPQESSTFKRELLQLKPGAVLTAGQLAGDFVLPKDATQKLVFIAGGIGITPFRSMVKQLVDENSTRNIVLFYCARDEKDFAYTDIFKEAETLGLLKVKYITGKESVTEALMKEHVSDHTSRMFYLSGPNAMVEAYKTMLKSLGIKRTQIKTDYFPGF